LKIVKDEKFMDQKDIDFLYSFKNKVRNNYQHIDNGAILKGVKVPVWKINFTDPEDLVSQIKIVKENKIKPEIVLASEMPAIQSIIREKYDFKMSIEIFNEVYDFLVLCNCKYFNQQEWDEYHQKFSPQNL
jgi:hypothetical protein